jgi:hypothetical protein
VHTLFWPSLHLSLCPLPPPLTSRQNLFCPVLQFCWRENIRNNKKDIAFLLAWDKDSYSERFLALLPCTSVLQPKYVHLYQTSSLLPGHLPIVPSVSLRLIYSIFYSRHIKYFQVLGFLPFLYPSCMRSPLSMWLMSNYIFFMHSSVNGHLSWCHNVDSEKWHHKHGYAGIFIVGFLTFISLVI